MKLKFIFLLMFALCFSAQAVAQINILKKMEEAVDKKADTIATNIAAGAMEKILSKVLSNDAQSTSSDSTEQSNSPSNAKQSSTITAESILSGFSNSKVDKQFSFDYSFDYLMEGTNDEGQPFTQNMKTRVPDSGEYILMEIQGISTIVDYTDGMSYTLVNDRVMQFSADRIISQMYGDIGSTEKGDTKVTKTNEREVKEGYPCVKYVIESDDMTSEVWITEKFIMAPDGNIFAKMDPELKNFDFSGKRYYPMEIKSIDKNGEAHNMTVSNVQKESFVLDLSQY